MRVFVMLALAVISFSSVGCASMFASGPDWVPVNSTPQGADVKLDGVRVGKTPMVLPLSRSSDGVFDFELAGFEPLRLDLDKVLNGWFMANFLWGWLFPVGMGVDVVSGCAGKFSTDPVHVELVPKKAARRP